MKLMKTTAIDFQSLSLFRILLAVYLIVDFCFNVLPYFGDFFTNQGLFPLEYLWVAAVTDHPVFQVSFIVLYLVAAFCFGIGYRTRLANFILLLTYMAMSVRAIPLVSGAETVARLLLLWSMFLPMARYWSVDAALDNEPRDRFYPYLPVFAIKLQISIIYIASALWKLAGTSWHDGTAVEASLRDNLFGGTALGLYIVDHWGGWLWIATYGVIALQLLFTPLVYSPWYNNWTRGIGLFLAFMMHVSFILLLRVGPFPYICCIYLVLLVPDEWWNMLREKWRRHLDGLRIYYDPDCPFCHKVALLFREFCLPNFVPVLPADQDAKTWALLKAHNSWVVYDPKGYPWFRWRAVAYVLRQNPVFWLAGWLSDLPFLRNAFDQVYQWIGRRRATLGQIAAALLPFRSEKPIGKPALWLCGMLAVLMVVQNVATIPWAPIFDAKERPYAGRYVIRDEEWQKTLRSISIGAFVIQKWNLFAPNPFCFISSYTFTGTEEGGQRIDLAPRVSPFFVIGRENNYALSTSPRQTKYMERIRRELDKDQQWLQKYLCRKANKDKTAPFIKQITITVTRSATMQRMCIPENPFYEESYACPATEK